MSVGWRVLTSDVYWVFGNYKTKFELVVIKRDSSIALERPWSLHSDVTAKLEQVYSTERIGPLSQRRDMKRVYSFFPSLKGGANKTT
jgi:hypothetical protein